MNREQFIAQLARLLQDLPPAERQEAIRYYQEYFVRWNTGMYFRKADL